MAEGKSGRSILLTTANHANNMLAGFYRQYMEGKNCDLELRLLKCSKNLHVHKCLFTIYMQRVNIFYSYSYKAFDNDF